NVDLEILNNQDLDEDTYTGRYNMLDIAGLNYTIDSLYVDKNKDYEALSKTLYNRTTYQALNNNINTSSSNNFNGDILELYNLRVKVQLLNLALNTANSTKQIIETNSRTFETRSDWLNRHVIALHEKYVLGFACIILFFVGAPLGALIRKGGIGLPMVIAILLFLTYHFIGIFAKNSSRDGTINPMFATWLSTLIMLPLGVYLTSRATKDRGLFDMDLILDPIKRLFKFKSTTQLSESETKSLNYFKKYNTDELVAVIKKQQEFDLDKKPKEIAIRQLLTRKLTLNELQAKGLDIPEFLIQSKKIQKDYNDYASTSLISYGVALVLLILHFVFKNNKLPELAVVVLDLSIVSWVFFTIFVLVSILTYASYYISIKSKSKRRIPLWMLLLTPIYPLLFLFLKSKTNQDFEQSCIKNIN
ncbi:MAG: LptF/LptG family permease, partial [Winogradskyella sp.]|nr:LptF/LptG family permease [Winogradskyella sp.]